MACLRIVVRKSVSQFSLALRGRILGISLFVNVEVTD